MNKNTKTTQKEQKTIITNNKTALIIGSVFCLTSLALFVSFVSYFFSGDTDQSVANALGNTAAIPQNALGKLGAFLAQSLVFDGFGLAAFIIPKTLLIIGAWFIFRFSYKKVVRHLFWDSYLLLTLSLALGAFGGANDLTGNVGYQTFQWLKLYLGGVGATLLIIFFIIFFCVLFFKNSPELMNQLLMRKNKQVETSTSEQQNSSTTDKNKQNTPPTPEEKKTTMPITIQPIEDSIPPKKTFIKDVEEPTYEKTNTIISNEEEDFVIETTQEEETNLDENLAEKLVADFGEFDPTLDLPNYKFPTIELLKDYTVSGITINQAELEENKNKIVDTLQNYKIGIDKIKATVGPTVTLYEIVPEAGVRISKIKNLEDDIALSLSALGIRIIAPIPGKGTIGIEVPNANPSMVPMKSLISSKKFQTVEMELPIALGKTISNETFIVDLAKMPHLLMAGATGQGKSVGLNVILTSLLYKKHPAEVKFVLVDPKKVELTLFNKIERHYLAKLPNTEDAIITDNTKVINTLNSLCIEMDTRYDLLKEAMVRNIKEYNEKFKQRKLNPEKGHRFLPYIILVVDEFADLIMTAGKEVEMPIARLAQLARAIGIHLIIATQRPSVNVITGIIKANFPSRIAFRVTSKIDSRTILDGPGADQLIGRGDLLYIQGNEPVRVQCAFVDTSEVENITDFIGSQKAYPDAYMLPEYEGEENGTSLDIDISERDNLFREAAEVIVTTQQGSASLLQRKLKLGYNRAGRLIDQLEAAGIVGPFEGSKARSVLVPDLATLDELLNNE